MKQAGGFEGARTRESTDSQEYQQHSKHEISSEREMETFFGVGKKAIMQNPLGGKGSDHSN